MFFLKDVAKYTDYTWEASVANEDNDGVGIVFRYQDKDNMYKYQHNNDFTWGGCATLMKVKNGQRTELWRRSNYQDYSQSSSSWYGFKIVLSGCTMTGSVDGVQDFSLTDADCIPSGAPGLYSHGNDAGYWKGMKVTAGIAGASHDTGTLVEEGFFLN